MKQLKKLILKLWFWFCPKQQINQVNKKLEKAVIDKKNKQIILLTEIKTFLVKDLKIDYKSKHIPLNVRFGACKKVNRMFGTRMKDLGVKININLSLVLV